MAAVVIIAALLFVFINGMRKRHKEAEEVKKGVAYLKETGRPGSEKRSRQISRR